MKRFLQIFLLLVLVSCSAGKADYNLPEETFIVTVKKGADGRIFFQQDDNTILYPLNYSRPYNGLQRIICGLAVHPGGECGVLWMDFLEKGPTVAFSGQDLSSSGGIDVLEDWMTSVEDGFLTLHYATWWGDGSIQHSLSLVTGANPENPYELWLIHSSNADAALERADALTYFDINDLPPTGAEYVNLILKWKNGEGQISGKTFRFRNRMD